MVPNSNQTIQEQLETVESLAKQAIQQEPEFLEIEDSFGLDNGHTLNIVKDNHHWDKEGEHLIISWSFPESIVDPDRPVIPDDQMTMSNGLFQYVAQTADLDGTEEPTKATELGSEIKTLTEGIRKTLLAIDGIKDLAPLFVCMVHTHGDYPHNMPYYTVVTHTK